MKRSLTILNTLAFLCTVTTGCFNPDRGANFDDELIEDTDGMEMLEDPDAPVDEPSEDPADEPADEPIDDEPADEPIDAVVLELFYWEGMTSAAIAEALGEPHGTVRTRLRRARELLREAIVSLPGAKAQAQDGATQTTADLDGWAAKVRASQ